MSNPRIKSTASVQATYPTAREGIIDPTHYASLSHYFVDNWLPSISANGLKMLLALRKLGYYNPKTGATRGNIDVDQDVLAARAGISVRTLQRIFADDPVFCKYVQRVFQIERDRTGRIIREHYTYVVIMGDVLTEADEARLALMQEGPEKVSLPPTRQSDASESEPKRQSDARAGHNDAPKRLFDAPTRQNDASYIGSLITENTVDTPVTPGAAPDSSASLFQERKEPGRPKAKGRAGWIAEDSPFARAYCRTKGWARPDDGEIMAEKGTTQ